MSRVWRCWRLERRRGRYAGSLLQFHFLQFSDRLGNDISNTDPTCTPLRAFFPSNSQYVLSISSTFPSIYSKPVCAEKLHNSFPVICTEVCERIRFFFPLIFVLPLICYFSLFRLARWLWTSPKASTGRLEVCCNAFIQLAFCLVLFNVYKFTCSRLGGFSNITSRPSFQSQQVSQYLRVLQAKGLLPPSEYANLQGRGYPGKLIGRDRIKFSLFSFIFLVSVFLFHYYSFAISYFVRYVDTGTEFFCVLGQSIADAGWDFFLR
jgi:hypothetical protein